MGGPWVTVMGGHGLQWGGVARCRVTQSGGDMRGGTKGVLGGVMWPGGARGGKEVTGLQSVGWPRGTQRPSGVEGVPGGTAAGLCGRERVAGPWGEEGGTAWG